jgi:hypothetical protein
MPCEVQIYLSFNYHAFILEVLMNFLLKLAGLVQVVCHNSDHKVFALDCNSVDCNKKWYTSRLHDIDKDSINIKQSGVNDRTNK